MRIVLLASLTAAGALVATGCASGRAPVAASAPAWEPVRAESPPPASRMQRDRDAFVDRYRAVYAAHIAEAERKRRYATLTQWSGFGLAMLELLTGHPLTIFGDPGAQDITERGLDALLLYTLPAYMLDRRFRGEAAVHTRCAEYLDRMVPAFSRKWTAVSLPRSDSSWTEYRADQTTIAEGGPC